MSTIYDTTPCELGEGPLWHPGRGQLFWFDIIDGRLLSREGGRLRQWRFDEHVSAAGWISETALLVASETRLLVLELETDRREDVVPLEADDRRTRSNDGRADPWGGFWIGTMGKGAEPGLGSIYRFYRGEVRLLFHPITIPNSICFTPDRSAAYFADTPTAVIRRVALDTDGWPQEAPEDWLDLVGQGMPDGSVTDVEGNVWNAQWGGGRVACYAPDGRFLRAVAFGAANTTCPAFGGPDMTTLFCTSARQGRSAEEIGPEDGVTFAAEDAGRGIAEARVLL